MLGRTNGSERSERARLEANVRWFYVYRFLANLTLWLPIWILYLQRQRGLTLGQISALDAPFWLVVVLAQVPTGAFADRFGRRQALLAGNAILALAYLVFGLASSYPVILASYVVWAIGMAFRSGADLAFLYDTLAALDRLDEYSRAAGRSFSLMALAGIVSLIAGAWLADVTRLDVPVVTTAGIALLSVAVVVLLYEPPRLRGETPSMLAAVRRGTSIAWREPRLRYVIGFAATVRAASFVPVLFTQPFLEHIGAPVGSYGLLQTPARIGAVIAALWSYRLMRSLGEERGLPALALWLCGWMLLLALWDDPLAFVAFPLLAIGFAGADPVFSSYLNRHIPAAERATVLSLGELLASLVLIGLEPGFGNLAQALGLRAAFWGGFVFVAVLSAITLLPWARAIRQDERPRVATMAVGEGS
jgi:MFS family permease